MLVGLQESLVAQVLEILELIQQAEVVAVLVAVAHHIMVVVPVVQE
jgi:hypothetical protein